jgi:diguanylate cyclase (GGDEF)-like protein
MMLDYQSLLLALGVSAACLMATLLGTWLSRRTDSFLLTLVICLGLIVTGIFAYSFYTRESGVTPAAITYVFLMSGFSTIYAASVQFRLGTRPWPLAAGLSFVSTTLGLPFFFFGFDGIGFIVMNLATTLLLGGTAYQYWSARAEAPGPLMGMAVLYSASGLSFFLCAVVLVDDRAWVIGQAPHNWAENLNIGICIAGMTGIGALSLALHQWRMAALHRHEARTDALTGLLNRRALFDQYGGRKFGASAAVIVFDIDRFKMINDQHGHSAGDEVLRVFAQDMLAEVPPTACVARIGGEEFAVIVIEVMPGRAERIANEVRRRFSARDIVVEGAVLRCTVSAGVSVGLAEGQPFEAVLNLADTALYEAKRSGRDRVELASYLHSIPAPPISDSRTSA